MKLIILCSPGLHLINFDELTLYFNIFYGKTEFSASLLQSSVWHGPSEIILIYTDFVLKKHFLLLAMLKNNCAAYSAINRFYYYRALKRHG